jgi:membrane protein YqaA with SNARE-associated domain
MKLDDKTKAVLQILAGIAIAALIFVFADKIAELQEYGYIGVFFISMFSAATIFVPAPGWAIVIAMGGILNPYLVGIVAGVGSGIGEITGYLVGSGARDLSDTKLGKYKDFIKKYGVGAVFVLAFVPNPFFDVAGLVAGALKIKVWQFLIACILGRTLRYIILAYFGAWALAQF